MAIAVHEGALRPYIMYLEVDESLLLAMKLHSAANNKQQSAGSK